MGGALKKNMQKIFSAGTLGILLVPVWLNNVEHSHILPRWYTALCAVNMVSNDSQMKPTNFSSGQILAVRLNITWITKAANKHGVYFGD